MERDPNESQFNQNLIVSISDKKNFQPGFPREEEAHKMSLVGKTYNFENANVRYDVLVIGSRMGDLLMVIRGKGMSGMLAHIFRKLKEMVEMKRLQN